VTPFIAAVVALGALAVAHATASTDILALDPMMFALLAALAAIAQRMSVMLFRQAGISVAMAATVATYVLYGVGPAIWVNLIAAAVSAFSPRKELRKAVFNAGNLSLSAYIAAITYGMFGGTTPPGEILDTVIAVAVSGLVYVSVASALVSLAVAATTGGRFGAIWQENYGWTMVNCLAVSINGAALAIAIQILGIFGFFVFSLPLSVAWYSFKLYTVRTNEVRQRSLELHGARERLTETAERLQSANISVIGALMGAIEAKDPYTEGHCAATVYYAAYVARRMGLSPEEVAQTELGALFHDIGKIGIPEGILRKTGPLTIDEWAVMRTHPTIGGHLLAQVPALASIIPLVVAHHERFDGTGYPGGLAGEEIPLAARIIAVADSYHAMTSTRPYRMAMTKRAARRELRDNAGTQFDPRVVEAFIETLSEDRRRTDPSMEAARHRQVRVRALEAVRLAASA
jgi:hypothetical protein